MSKCPGVKTANTNTEEDANIDEPVSVVYMLTSFSLRHLQFHIFNFSVPLKTKIESIIQNNYEITY